MKKNILLLIAGILSFSTTYAQVGINTESPLVGLHVVPFSTDASTAEGIIAPNLTRAQLIAKDARYTAAYKGAFVYITAIDGTVTTKTAKITTTGYYYFDGTEWKHFNDKLQNADNGLSVNNATAELGGTLTKATTIAKGTYALNLTGSGTVNIAGNTTLNNNLTAIGVTTLNSTSINVENAGESFIINDGSVTKAGKYLKAMDNSGKAEWQDLGTLSTAPPIVFNTGLNFDPSASGGNDTGSHIILPPGRWMLQCALLFECPTASVTVNSADKSWVNIIMTRADGGNVLYTGSKIVSGTIYRDRRYNMIHGYFIVTNDTASSLEYRFRVSSVQVWPYTWTAGRLVKCFSSSNGENAIVAFSLTE